MKYILSGSNITVFAGGKPHAVNRDAKIFPAIMKAIQADDEEEFLRIANTKEEVALKSNGKVQIKDGNLMYGDRVITGLISTRIFEMLELGLSIDPMLLFVENMLQNPSKRAVDELFDFIEACDLPITEDGCFLAYKKVRGDYMDCYSGSIRNAVGDTPSMERNMVDEDKHRTCSYGLHFCSHEYLKHFGGERVMVLKINPAEVVAIPSDYNNSKGRCCKYEVVAEIATEGGLPTKRLNSSYYVENQDEIESTSDEIAEKSSGIKMTRELAEQLRDDYEHNGYEVSALVDKYGISRRQVNRIIDYQAWV